MILMIHCLMNFGWVLYESVARYPYLHLVGHGPESIVTLAHALAVETLPAVHKDPFDRLLIAQAQVEGIPLLSRDALFAHYPIAVIW